MMGTGKERGIARRITIEYLNAYGSVLDEFVKDADVVCVVNSTEGGNGSGASSVIYKYLLNVCVKNVLGFAFTGFEEDSRGLKNTLEFFRDADPHIALQVISNKKFLPFLGKNKLQAERLANEEFVERLRIIRGLDLQESTQNIDKTDLLKLVTTPGYIQVEHFAVIPEPHTELQMNQLLAVMLHNSKSLPTTSTCKRLGVILSLQDDLKDVVDYSYADLIKYYGTPYELFTHVQEATTRGNEICIIAAGLEMPMEAVQAVYDTFKVKTQQVAKGSNSFADAIAAMVDVHASEVYDMPRKTFVTEEELIEKKKQFAEGFSQV
jgi:hypothetical protein